jgi:hypothetical protein
MREPYFLVLIFSKPKIIGNNGFLIVLKFLPRSHPTRLVNTRTSGRTDPDMII